MTATVVGPLPAPLTQHGSDPTLLGKELLAEISRSIDEHPRSQQVAIGPSEVGHPCARRIGYKLLNYPERSSEPNWKATVGTYAHAGLEQVMDNANVRLAEGMTGQERFLIEEDLVCGTIGDQLLTGHCDLYDRVTDTVVDWKTVGPAQLKKYKAHGPGDQYRVQAHIYGRGWALRGFPVQRVAVMFLPRNGELRESYWWTEDYDEQVAVSAIARVTGIKLTTDALGPAALPMLGTADAYCNRCPFFAARSTDLTAGCPGDPSSQTHPHVDPAAPAFGYVTKEGTPA